MGKGESVMERLQEVRRGNAGTRTARYHVVALSCTYGGGDEVGEVTALHRDAHVRQAAVGAAAVPHPHQCQHCCHDNQLHSLLGAAQTSTARGDEAQTLQTV